MNNTYIVKDKVLNKILDNIISFEEKATQFIENHPNYKYNITLDKNEITDEWVFEFNINNSDEQKYTQ